MNAVIESQFLGPIAAFAMIKECNELYIESQETYQKRSFRNKCHLAGPNGKFSFTVPLLKGKHQQQKITEVEISYAENWTRQFLQLCQSNYSRSPYYDYIIEDLEFILLQQHQYLYELNHALLHWVCTFLDLETNLLETTEYHTAYIGEEFEDYRQCWLPGKQIQNARYAQVFEEKSGFVAGLSILDLIFCCGKESVLYF